MVAYLGIAAFCIWFLSIPVEGGEEDVAREAGKKGWFESLAERSGFRIWAPRNKAGGLGMGLFPG